MGDLWKLVVPIAGALVVGVLLHLLKEGGLRRLRRRNIREELELLKLLDDHPEPAARIQKRVAVMLEQYEPEPQEPRRTKSGRRVILDVGLLLVASSIVVALSDPMSRLQTFAVGAAIALAYNFLDGWWERRLERREQDVAVAQGSGQGTLHFHGSGTGVAPPVDGDNDEPPVNA